MKDIEINARLESTRMRHFFLGVEHYFVGMLDIPGGLLPRLIETHGLTPEYLKDAVRRYTGRGANKRPRYAGIPTTPRAATILNLAYELARESGRDEADERDLLLATLEEGSSIPVRVLRRLGIDLRQLMEQAAADSSRPAQRHGLLKIDFGSQFDPSGALSDDEVFILRRMFYGYASIRIERRLTGGYSGAAVVLVTPIHADASEDALVVVKIGEADSLLDEERRYNTFVRNTLPPLTARLEDKTTAEHLDLAGLKYTFVADRRGMSASLRVQAQELGAERLGDWLKEELFPYFGRNWWTQRRPYRFTAWAEYDWLLPPLLTLDFVAEDEAKSAGKPSAFTVRDPVKRSRAEALEYGDLVAVENFVVQKLYRDKKMLRLSLGLKTSETMYNAHRILVRQVDPTASGFFRGEMVDTLYGRVWKTRRDSFAEALSILDPDFDPHAADIPFSDAGDTVANPLLNYDPLLDRTVNGAWSKIHGDLNLGNILTGPNDSPFLIDFAHARSGHTAFDWASLEISILAEIVVPSVGSEWSAARRIAPILAGLHRGDGLPNDAIGAALRPIMAVRAIAAECLSTPNDWVEYDLALAMASLRALTWNTMSVGARRLMLFVAGMAQRSLYARPDVTGTQETLRDGERTSE
jgi:hypothetical protein